MLIQGGKLQLPWQKCWLNLDKKRIHFRHEPPLKCHIAINLPYVTVSALLKLSESKLKFERLLFFKLGFFKNSSFKSIDCLNSRNLTQKTLCDVTCNAHHLQTTSNTLYHFFQIAIESHESFFTCIPPPSIFFMCNFLVPQICHRLM